jgi:SPP1 gp7 family putative phage head morphogenesis protein
VSKPSIDNRTANTLIGRGILTAESIADELRRRLVERLTKENGSPYGDIISEARQILSEFEPIIAEHISAMDLYAWVAGVHELWRTLPPNLQNIAFQDRFRIQPPRYPGPPTFIGTAFGEDGEPTVRFPLIERAYESLYSRGVVTRDEFNELSQEAKQRAFAVAGDWSTETVERIRDTLADTIRDGASLSGFKNRLNESLDKGSIGSAHIETIYRTNVMTAFHEGHDSLMDNPIVDAVFPYQEYMPIGDNRTRPEHEALGFLGLNGTGVYRRDDPFWEFFTPPCGYNCRCGIRAVSLEEAARMGVKEAQKWLRTGRPPEQPEWRIEFIPFRPPAGFGRGKRERVAA